MQKEPITIERYQRQRLLGQGPMSVVWLARDTETQNLVALKIMTAITEDDRRNLKANERFTREIEIARSLQHPHILPVLDSGDTLYNGRSVPFLVSPYIPDGSLVDIIEETPPWEYWSLQQIADAISQAADSLWYLHTRSPHIVHEDVKPANFLVRTIQSPQRAVHLYLSDFGISRWQKSPGMMASEVLGTFAFMAPEQAEKKVNPASDQYALAIVATYMLTGKLPIQAATNEEYIHAHLYEVPFTPGELFPDRFPPSQVDDVMLRALEKSPSKRFPTIIAFGQALAQALVELEQEEASATTERLSITDLDTEVEYDAAEPIAPHAEQSFDNMPIALSITNTGEHRILDEPLPEKPRQDVSTNLSIETLNFRSLALPSPARYELPARPKSLSWSRDGNILACTLYGHVPLFLQRNGKMGLVQIPAAHQASTLCWSPDGRVLAIGVQGEIRFWDVVSGGELPLAIPMNVRTIDNMDWSKNWQLAIWIDASIILYSLPLALLMQHQAPIPERISTNAARSGSSGVLRWSPNGSYLAIGASNGAIVCWDREHENALWQVATSGQKVNSLTWSPDSTLLACAFRDSRIVAWNVQKGERMLQWHHLPAMARSLSISMEQRIVVASSERRLLSGLLHEAFPTASIPGQLLVACSPTRSEFATLDEQRENILAIWHE
ncbi:MAG: serine/threonine-protein kinase [Ktedonobacteraceae bacterium]